MTCFLVTFVTCFLSDVFFSDVCDVFFSDVFLSDVCHVFLSDAFFSDVFFK